MLPIMNEGSIRTSCFPITKSTTAHHGSSAPETITHVHEFLAFAFSLERDETGISAGFLFGGSDGLMEGVTFAGALAVSDGFEGTQAAA